MKNLLVMFIGLILTTFVAKSQCSNYQIYESFSATIPTQGGTWTNTSVPYSTTNSPKRTGTNHLVFNGVNDAIRTPLIANPGVLTFWYRRSSNTTAWTLRIQTSPDGTTWTNRGSITSVTATYQQYTLDIGALGLTNVYIRLLDARGSGSHERYVDDLGLTSTVSSENTLIPMISDCSQTLNSSFTYNLTDDAGPVGPIAGGYSNNVDRTVTLTPSDNTKKLQLEFTQMDLETDFDYLYIYDGPNTSSTLLATITGTTIPADITATNASGQLTIRWTTDVSNIGTWGGFAINITSIVPCTTPTNGGSISTNKVSTTVNDGVTLTTSGNSGVITKFEWSYNNFSTIDGTINSPTNPYNIVLNVQQPQIWFRTQSKQGSCPEGPSSIVSVTLANATPYTDWTVDGDYISNVTLLNIDNNSTTDGDGYQDFTNLAAFLTKGETYPLTVTATNTFQSGQGYAAWIDWNNNGIFETTENVLLSGPANSVNQNITVPQSAFEGDVLMRVLSVWGQTPSNDAYFVGPYGWGEIEEYIINISAGISLPVELTDFYGIGQKTSNDIFWNTATEHNSSHFELYSSIDGQEWRLITTKNAAGNSNQLIKYAYKDYTTYSLTYYKLVQYDFDGQSKEYGPISVSKVVKDKKIIKYINSLGQEVNSDSSGLIFIVYDDGSITKKIN